jgi:hypothetical protein
MGQYHSLHINFKKAYDSVQREMYNILTEFDISMKLGGLINRKEVGLEANAEKTTYEGHSKHKGNSLFSFFYKRYIRTNILSFFNVIP